MEEIKRLVALAQTDRFTLVDLSEQFNVSRKTAYKWLGRYAAQGWKALEGPRSSRPLHSPGRTEEVMEALILAERKLHRTWGPKKLRAVLAMKHGIESPPACSTIAEMLRRAGLSVRRRRRPGVYPPQGGGCSEANQPNAVWTVDFKGWFLLGDDQRCDPLTVCDHYSRFVVCARGRPNQQYLGTLQVFKGLMRHHGLPEVIHCDLGAPFSSCGLGRLSALSVWWIEQGIEVEFSRPGSPQDNGAHERMHRDLKAETTQPPSANLAAQQRRMERWRQEFNHDRPHEALGQRTPASLYQPSTRRLGEHDKPLVYPGDCEVKTISTSGFLAHEGRNYYAGEIFSGKPVSLHATTEGQTQVHFGNVHLGDLAYDAEGGRFRPAAYIARPRSPQLAQPESTLDYSI